MYDLDNANDVPGETKKYEPEAIIHFDEKDRGILEIKVNRNETLIREKLKNINNKVKFNNILILYIDSISRFQFLKRMPITRKVLEKYYSDDITNLKDEKYINFQFLKYLNFEVKTPINTVPMFLGVPYIFDENKPEYGIHLNKYLDQQGYITAFGNEQCAKVSFDVNPKDIKHLQFYPYDHEIAEIFCDPHFSNPDRMWNFLKGVNSVTRRCLYGKDTYNILFDFGKKFLKAYEDYPRKFLRIGLLQAHETSLEVIKYMDKDFSIFLENFINSYYNKDWAIFIVSDHGNGITFYRTEQWRKEMSFGTLFLLLPKTNISNFNINVIRDNEQKVVTPYDIHNTLLDMIGLNREYFNKKGNSTLDFVDSTFKNCEFFMNELRETRREYCTCIPYNK